MFSSTACCQGYQGLVDGGDHIRPATWESVSMMLQLVRAIMRIFLTHQHFFSLFLMYNQDGSLVKLLLYPRQCSSVGRNVV